jgi:hypothetical protein
VNSDDLDTALLALRNQLIKIIGGKIAMNRLLEIF